MISPWKTVIFHSDVKLPEGKMSFFAESLFLFCELSGGKIRKMMKWVQSLLQHALPSGKLTQIWKITIFNGYFMWNKQRVMAMTGTSLSVTGVIFFSWISGYKTLLRWWRDVKTTHFPIIFDPNLWFGSWTLTYLDPNIWVNYNDLNLRPHHRWWLVRGIIPRWP